MDRILLVSDDPGLREELRRDLTGLGFDTRVVSPAELALNVIRKANPDLVLIHCSRNWHRARSVCRELKGEEETRGIPLIVFIPEGEDRDFDLLETADDFIMLPCRPEELALRIRRIQRRKGSQLSGEGIRIGGLTIDFAGYEVLLHGLPVAMTYKEYELLKFLVTHPNRVFSRHTLLRKVWGYEAYVGTRTVDIHIRRLRSKLGELGSGIQTVRNVGYKFNPELFTNNLPS